MTTAKPFDLTKADLNLLAVFEALMVERHVGRAAARLHLSQSATSHALGRLRDLLHDELFVRHPKGIEPTARARALAEPVTEVLARVRSIVAPPRPFDPSTLSRSFAIGATDYAAVAVVAPILATLQAEAPGVELRLLPIDGTSVVGGLDRGDLDLAIGNFPSLPQRVEAIPLFEERFVGVVRRGHPGLTDGRMDLATFVALKHALVSPRGDARGRVDEVLGQLGLERHVAVTVSGFLSLPFMLENSDMVGVLAECISQRLAETAGLHLFDLPVDLAPWTVHLCRLGQLAADPELGWLTARLASLRRMSAERRHEEFLE